MIYYEWQNEQCSKLSDNDLILGMVLAYKQDACDAEHVGFIEGHLPTDECRYFKYVSGQYKGMCDHFNMRIFNEWCQKNRPQVLERLNNLKVFW